MRQQAAPKPDESVARLGGSAPFNQRRLETLENNRRQQEYSRDEIQRRVRVR